MATIAKNPPKYHELCQALDAIPRKGREEDPSIPGINTREKAALLALASFYGPDGQVFPTLSTLAEKMCMPSNESTRRVLASLEKKGYIWREERCCRDQARGKARQTSNNWHFSEAVFLLGRLQKQTRHLLAAEWDMGADKVPKKLRESIKKTRIQVLFSLESTRSRKPTASKRNGQLGQLTKQIRRYTRTVESMKEHLERKKLSQRQYKDLEDALLQESVKLRQVSVAREQLLAVPDEQWTWARPLEPGERKRKLSIVSQVIEEPDDHGAVEVVPVACPEPEAVCEEEATHELKHSRAVKDCESEKPQDYSALYQLWKDKKGPALSKKDKLVFERESGMEPEDALAACEKVLSSPFLRSRFRSLLWLSHIDKEDYFEKKAQKSIGKILYNKIFHERKTPEEAILDLPTESRFETYKGTITLQLNKNLILPWVKPWVDQALKDSEERKTQEAIPVDLGPPLKDFPF